MSFNRVLLTVRSQSYDSDRFTWPKYAKIASIVAFWFLYPMQMQNWHFAYVQFDAMKMSDCDVWGRELPNEK